MRLARLGAVAVAGLLLVALQIVLRGDRDLEAQVAGQLVAFALFLPAAVLCWRGLGVGRAGAALVLVFAVGFRAAAFDPDVTPLTTDLNRYAWEARVQAQGINPYRYAPDDPALADLRDDEIWPHVGFPSWRTAYPPAAQASFVAGRLGFGDGLRATTPVYLLAEALAVGLLLLLLVRRGEPPERVAVYAWHPLAVSEIAANGHVDALVVLALAGLLAAWQTRRYAAAGAATALAVLAKLVPILLVPALARRGGVRFAATALALVVLGYAPYLGVGTRVFGSVATVARENFPGGLMWALRSVAGQPAAAVLSGLVLAAVLVAVSAREHASADEAARSCLLLLGTALLAARYAQPWYALWLLPFLVVVVAPGWTWLTATMPLLYLAGLPGPTPAWIRPVIYAPLAAWAAWQAGPIFKDLVSAREPARGYRGVRHE